MPVTVLGGLQDRVFYDAADVAALDACTVDLPDIGHPVTMERPQAVVDACLAPVGRSAC